MGCIGSSEQVADIPTSLTSEFSVSRHNTAHLLGLPLERLGLRQQALSFSSQLETGTQDGSAASSFPPASYWPPESPWRIYALRDTVGRGKFSRVRECVHRETQQRYAMKIIAKDKVQSPCSQMEYAREWHMQRRLGSHPHIVQLHEAFQTEDSVYLLLELCRGGDLHQYVGRHHHIGEAQTASIVQQIAYALLYMHHLGVVHRDVKLENIFLVDPSSCFVKLGDFGLCGTSNTESQKLHSRCGTMAYAAPEQGNGDYGAAVDTWALGIAMYTMMCGYHPFDEYGLESMIALEARKRLGMFEFSDRIWDTISDEPKAIIRRMLTVDPDKRMKLHELLQSPWISRHCGPLPAAAMELVTLAERRSARRASRRSSTQTHVRSSSGRSVRRRRPSARSQHLRRTQTHGDYRRKRGKSSDSRSCRRRRLGSSADLIVAAAEEEMRSRRHGSKSRKAQSMHERLRSGSLLWKAFDNRRRRRSLPPLGLARSDSNENHSGVGPSPVSVTTAPLATSATRTPGCASPASRSSLTVVVPPPKPFDEILAPPSGWGSPSVGDLRSVISHPPPLDSPISSTADYRDGPDATRRQTRGRSHRRGASHGGALARGSSSSSLAARLSDMDAKNSPGRKRAASGSNADDVRRQRGSLRLPPLPVGDTDDDVKVASSSRPGTQSLSSTPLKSIVPSAPSGSRPLHVEYRPRQGRVLMPATESAPVHSVAPLPVVDAQVHTHKIHRRGRSLHALSSMSFCRDPHGGGTWRRSCPSSAPVPPVGVKPAGAKRTSYTPPVDNKVAHTMSAPQSPPDHIFIASAPNHGAMEPLECMGTSNTASLPGQTLGAPSQPQPHMSPSMRSQLSPLSSPSSSRLDSELPPLTPLLSPQL